jgi:hypothetical protein
LEPPMCAYPASKAVICERGESSATARDTRQRNAALPTR